MANSPTELTWQRAFERAIAHHRSGELAEAESIYRQILAHDSDQGGTINLLAQLFHQTGRGSEAADLLRQAIKVNPSVPDYHANLGVILASGGNFTEAIPAFRNAVRL